ncbi:MAG: hypothetical protein JXI43_05535 [Tissierellales bacterium]|nr:hypothetical protein [Tissierellales bacterium]
MKNGKKQFLFSILIVLLAISGFLLIGAAYGFFKLPKLVEEINNAAIGAIITAVITVMLLQQQTSSGELRERNSKVFEKKLQFVERFLQELKKIIKDGKIEKEEIDELLFNAAYLRLHCSEETVKGVLKQVVAIKSSLDSDNTEKNNNLSIGLNNIVAVFRKELYDKDDAFLSIDASKNFYAVAMNELIPTTESPSDSGRHYYVLNTDKTNDPNAEENMLNGSMGTIWSKWKFKMDRINQNDIVFLYRSGTGIIAAGIADGSKMEIPEKDLYSIGLKTEFTRFENKAISPGEIKQITGINMVFLQTLFTTNSTAGEKLFNWIKHNRVN